MAAITDRNFANVIQSVGRRGRVDALLGLAKESVWLGGKGVRKGAGWEGSHAGKERVGKERVGKGRAGKELGARKGALDPSLRNHRQPRRKY